MKTRAEFSPQPKVDIKKQSKPQAKPLTDEQIEKEKIGPLFEYMAKYIFDVIQRRRRAEEAVGPEVSAAVQALMRTALDPAGMTEEHSRVLAKSILILAKHVVPRQPHLSEAWLALADSMTAIRQSAVEGVLVRSPITRQRFLTRGWIDESAVELFNWTTRSMWFQRHTMLNQRLNLLSERFLTQSNQRLEDYSKKLMGIWPKIWETQQIPFPNEVSFNFVRKLEPTIEILEKIPGNFDVGDNLKNIRADSVAAIAIGFINGRMPSARKRIRNIYNYTVELEKQVTSENFRGYMNFAIKQLQMMITARIQRLADYLDNENLRKKQMKEKNPKNTPFENYNTPDIAYGIDGWRKHVLRFTAYMNAAAMEYSAIPSPQAAWKRHLSVVADTVTSVGTTLEIGAYVLDQRTKTVDFLYEEVTKQRKLETAENLVRARVAAAIARGNVEFEKMFDFSDRPPEIVMAAQGYINRYKEDAIDGPLQLRLITDGQEINSGDLTQPITKQVDQSAIVSDFYGVLSSKKVIEVKDESATNSIILPHFEETEGVLIDNYNPQAVKNFKNDILLMGTSENLLFAKSMNETAQNPQTAIPTYQAWQNVMVKILEESDRIGLWLKRGIDFLGSVVFSWMAQQAKMLVADRMPDFLSYLTSNFIYTSIVGNIRDLNVSSALDVFSFLWSTFYFYNRRGLQLLPSLIMVVLQAAFLLTMEFHLAVLYSMASASALLILQRPFNIIFGNVWSLFKRFRGKGPSASEEETPLQSAENFIHTLATKIGEWGGYAAGMVVMGIAKLFSKEFDAKEMSDIGVVVAEAGLAALGLVTFTRLIQRYFIGITKSLFSLSAVMAYVIGTPELFNEAAVVSIGVASAYGLSKFVHSRYQKKIDKRSMVGALLLERPDLTLAGIQLTLVCTTLALDVFSSNSYMTNRLSNSVPQNTPVDQMFDFIGFYVAKHFPWFEWKLPKQYMERITDLIEVEQNPVEEVIFPFIACTDATSAGQCEVNRQIAAYHIYNLFLSQVSGARNFLLKKLYQRVRSIVEKYPEDFT